MGNKINVTTDPNYDPDIELEMLNGAPSLENWSKIHFRKK